MTKRPVIGFIGLGLMGAGMAQNIRKQGYELWVRGGRNRKGVEHLLSLGAREAGSPQEMAAHCDIIHICLSNSSQVEGVFRQGDGILAGAKPGLIVIDTSTSDPCSTIKLAEELEGKGGAMVDAPLGRTPKEAEEGMLDAMVGCDQSSLERIRPVMETWASSIRHIGPVGSGHKMKLIMNFIGLSYGAIYAEAVVLGAKVGLSRGLIRDVIAPSRMGCGFFDTFMQYVVDRDADAHKFTIANAAKDIDYASIMAKRAGTTDVMAIATRHYYVEAMNGGKSKDYVPSLCDHLAEINGIDLKKIDVPKPAGTVLQITR